MRHNTTGESSKRLKTEYVHESDVNQHIASFVLADPTSIFNLLIEDSEQETTSLQTASSVSEDHNTDSSANSFIQYNKIGSNSYSSPEVQDHEIEGASDLCASENRFKEAPWSPAAVNTGNHGLIPSSSRSDEADHDHEISMTETQSSCSLKEEFLSSLISPESNDSSHMLESEDELDDLPDYLHEITVDEELYNSEKANLPLFDGSSITVLEALFGYLAWFSKHPGTSKTSLSDLLLLHHKHLLPAGNNLPSSYDEAYSFVKLFLSPFVVYDVCPNDCVLFHKTDRYDFSTLTKCPTCNHSQFTANRSPAQKFYYYPLEPRWKRMYGNASDDQYLHGVENKMQT